MDTFVVIDGDFTRLRLPGFGLLVIVTSHAVAERVKDLVQPVRVNRADLAAIVRVFTI